MFFHDIETERLWLKGISPLDREFILRQFSNDDVTRYLFDNEPYTSLEQADELIDFYMQKEPRDRHRWILVRKSDGEKLGTCGFHRWDRSGASCEIGYDLYPDYWHSGYMSEAVDAIIPFAQKEMGVRQLDACISVDNPDSIRVAKNHGFAYAGRDMTYTFRGAEYPHHIYTLYLG